MNSSDSLSSKENFLENIIHNDLDNGFNKENLKFYQRNRFTFLV